MYSFAGNRYYVSFLNAHSRYIPGYFPCQTKVMYAQFFCNFKRMLNDTFHSQLKLFNLIVEGGEYRSLNKILANLGISHRLSCPHTPKKCAVEREHRHIVETGLALLSHASVPLPYWDDAFQTECYLINRLPTLNLKNSSLYETLFRSQLDYSLLRVFECVCMPNLRPYNSHKLQARSLQSIFLGYSLRHKGCHCLHLEFGRLYISRNVVFQETKFPFEISPILDPHQPNSYSL